MPSTDHGPADLDLDAQDSILAEFFEFLREERKWWLAPLVFCLVSLSFLLVAAQGSAISPFIYALF